MSYGYVNSYNSKKKTTRTSNTGTILGVDKTLAWLGWQAAGETIRVSTGKEPAVQGAVTHQVPGGLIGIWKAPVAS